jgi:hypothetical protein
MEVANCSGPSKLYDHCQCNSTHEFTATEQISNKCINNPILLITMYCGGGTGASINAGSLPGVTGFIMLVFHNKRNPSVSGTFNYTLTTSDLVLMFH